MFQKVTGKITYCAKTDPGLSRKINQDAIAIFTKDQLGLFVLSDGMGGHSRGELASGAIVTEFGTFWENITNQPEEWDFSVLADMIQQLIISVNRKIYLTYNQGQICGATVVILLVYKDCYAVFSVGDSRIYNSVGKKTHILTVDDIWDNLPETIQSLTPEEIAKNAKSGMLVQAVGTSPDVNVHVRTNRMKKGQNFLLCSDGLFKFCAEELITEKLEKIKSEKDIKKTMENYLQEVYANGAGDNVSIILVRVI